ncbi:hypothetical protein [Chryseobacterium sp. HR92]|uniref:hypothetical protein n=1 Tax=Chryseobacterium sp. HR92 TaxID=3094839 RepID=UPI0038900573|nr:hypothetical protein SFA27_06300 [Chryseobacterium sp. HR92]
MLLKKSLLILLFAFVSLFNAQRKKTDTLYVYEKVIVYDTIYLEKALKMKSQGLNLSPQTIYEAELIKRSPLKDEIKGKPIMLSKKLQYGGGIEGGIKKSFWDENAHGKSQQSGFGAGIWVSKSVYNRFLLMLSAHIYSWNSTFDLDANKEETWLNGYYFTEDHQPLLFQRFNNKHTEYAMQLKLLYDWKNIRPFIGFVTNKNDYSMQFLVPENNVLDKLEDFKSKQINFGFSLGLQYQLMKKFLLSLEYQEYKIKNISLKNSSFNFDIFKTSNTFAERKISLGISYIISGR